VELFESFEEEVSLMGTVVFSEVVLLEADVILEVDDFERVVGFIKMKVESRVVLV
jgi:hypothetical protein